MKSVNVFFLCIMAVICASFAHFAAAARMCAKAHPAAIDNALKEVGVEAMS